MCIESGQLVSMHRRMDKETMKLRDKWHQLNRRIDKAIEAEQWDRIASMADTQGDIQEQIATVHMKYQKLIDNCAYWDRK